MDSVWKFDLPDKEKTKTMLDYVGRQAKLLADLKNGSVKAIFCPKRQQSLEGISTELRERVQASLVGKRKHNASRLYDSKTYEFYITDKMEEYELNVFELQCKEYYPATLCIDEVIALEADCKKELKIYNFAEFECIFAKILDTDKIKCVISKLGDIVEANEHRTQ